MNQHLFLLLLTTLILGRIACKAPREVADTNCSDGIFGLLEIDKLYPSTNSESPLFQTSEFEWEDQVEFAMAMETADRRRAFELPRAAKIVLQNDLWGLFQRIDGLGKSSTITNRIKKAAASLIKKLALESPDAIRLNLDAPLPYLNRAGAEEMSSAFDILTHEKFYGQRRLFRIFHSQGLKTMISHLVAIDTNGEPYLTTIVGDVEVLETSPDGAVGTFVAQLDRRAIRCKEQTTLKAKERISHVPSLGANQFLFEGPAVGLEENPCRRCHHIDGGSTISGAPSLRYEKFMNKLIRSDSLLGHY